MQKIFIACFVVGSIQTFAQKSFFGVDAGINIANQREQTVFSPVLKGSFFFKNDLKPTFGVFYEYGISKILAVRVNLQYMGLGYRGSAPGFSHFDINYLTIPLKVKYSANEHFSLTAGTYLSFTLNGTKINNQNITNYYHKNDFGFSIGAEHDIYKNFALGVNYIIGTKNILLDDQGGIYKYNNRALQLTLIYKFKKTS
ncbi:MAG: porin family protein [Bacteroidetes bacterium]|nr:porin family protein [Bacteroidota bacterium]